MSSPRSCRRIEHLAPVAGTRHSLHRLELLLEHGRVPGSACRPTVQFPIPATGDARRDNPQVDRGLRRSSPCRARQVPRSHVLRQDARARVAPVPGSPAATAASAPGTATSCTTVASRRSASNAFRCSNRTRSADALPAGAFVRFLDELRIDVDAPARAVAGSSARLSAGSGRRRIRGRRPRRRPGDSASVSIRSTLSGGTGLEKREAFL